MTQATTTATSTADERLGREVARLLAALVRPAAACESLQVRRPFPGGPEQYAWSGRMPRAPFRQGGANA